MLGLRLRANAGDLTVNGVKVIEPGHPGFDPFSILPAKIFACETANPFLMSAVDHKKKIAIDGLKGSEN